MITQATGNIYGLTDQEVIESRKLRGSNRRRERKVMSGMCLQGLSKNSWSFFWYEMVKAKKNQHGNITLLNPNSH